MTKRPTVTVGIPAYNEESNIGNLLNAILNQKQDKFLLEKIIVVSDASDDKTDKIIRSFNDKKIKLIRNKKRVGAALSQNKITKRNSSDYLVMLDADILLMNKYVISNLISCFNKENIGMVYGKSRVLPAKNFLQIVLNFSVDMKQELYQKINKGNNIYLCRGIVRAFSKELAKKIKWEATVGEDAFSFLFCLANGYGVRYCSKANVKYTLPSSIKDHVRQSVRYFGSKKELKKYFDEELVKESYFIPFKLSLITCLKYFLKNPLYFIAYSLILAYSKLVKFFVRETNHIWDISYSTKRLSINNSK